MLVTWRRTTRSDTTRSNTTRSNTTRSDTTWSDTSWSDTTWSDTTWSDTTWSDTKTTVRVNRPWGAHLGALNAAVGSASRFGSLEFGPGLCGCAASGVPCWARARSCLSSENVAVGMAETARSSSSRSILERQLGFEGATFYCRIASCRKRHYRRKNAQTVEFVWPVLTPPQGLGAHFRYRGRMLWLGFIYLYLNNGPSTSCPNKNCTYLIFMKGF
jgi:hypothetical protein